MFIYMKSIHTSDDWKQAQKGSSFEINGEFITVRDATLQKIFTENDACVDSSLENNRNDSFFREKVIYFCGPTPPPLGKVIGSCGPTTSARMEPYFEKLGKAGVKAIIGKGEISSAAHETLNKYNVKYFVTVGGAGAFLSTKVTKAKIILFPELGAEAIHCLSVKNFPVISQ